MFNFVSQKYVVDSYELKKELKKRIDLKIFAKTSDGPCLIRNFHECIWSARMIEALVGTDGNPFCYISRDEMESRIENRWLEDCDKVVFKNIIEMIDNDELPKEFYLINYEF